VGDSSNETTKIKNSIESVTEPSIARKGSMLENLVENIFKSAGFEVKRNIFLKGFEIDVLVSFGDRTLLVECKQYEKSYLPVTNLILQWKAKNEIIKADGVILVIYGVDISENNLDLAIKYGIQIWSINELDYFLGFINEKEKLCAALLEQLELKERDIAETNASKLKKLIWTSLLSGSPTISDEKKYKVFRTALRSRIITNLKEFGSTAEIRQAHIEFFEKMVKKQEEIKSVWLLIFRSTIIHKHSNREIWEDIKGKLKELKPFDEETNLKYIGYMERLEQGFNEYYDWFLEDRMESNRKLLTERILNLVPGEYAIFAIANRIVMRVCNYEIIFGQSAIKNINILEWILTNRNYEIVNDVSESGATLVGQKLHWYPESAEETVEYLCRILYEYFGQDPKSIIRDLNIRE